MRLIRKAIDFLLHSNLFIGLAAVAIVCSGFIVLNGGVSAGLTPLLLLVGSATFLTYNLTLFLLEIGQPATDKAQKHSWFKTWFWWLCPLLLLALLIILYAVTQLSEVLMLFLLHLGLLSLSYTVPDRYLGPSHRSIRSIPLIKVFLIAYVWSAISAGIPFIILSIPLIESIKFLAAQFFFILSITLPFDIRDINKDQHQNLLTIPGWLGISLTRAIAICCMLCYLVVMGAFFSTYFLPSLLLCLPTIVLIYHTGPTRPYWYFTGLLDGLIVLQWLMLLILL